MLIETERLFWVVAIAVQLQYIYIYIYTICKYYGLAMISPPNDAFTYVIGKCARHNPLPGLSFENSLYLEVQ